MINSEISTGAISELVRDVDVISNALSKIL